MEWIFEEFKISSDKNLLSIDRICEFLSRSYWVNKRPKEKIELSIKNSICYGVFHNQKQVGFARIVTDFAVMYWIADVFIDEEYRGRGLGKKLIETIVNSNEYNGLIGLLGTKDAHGLYEKYGFITENNIFMRRKP